MLSKPRCTISTGPLSVPTNCSASSGHRTFAHVVPFCSLFSSLSFSPSLPSDLSASIFSDLPRFYSSILQMRKPRPRKVKQFAQEHTACKQYNWNLNSGSLTPEPALNSYIVLCKDEFTCVKRPGAGHKATLQINKDAALANLDKPRKL